MSAGEAATEGTGDDRQLIQLLPDAVRSRIIALAAEALGRLAVDQLPPALKRVASFAPSRRARLAGTQIAAVLETDEDFRERIGVQVRIEVTEIAGALDEGSRPAAADPAEVAAVAYLLRPLGWEAMVAEAAEVLIAERDSLAAQHVTHQIERLRGQLLAAQEELRSAREAHREELSRLKAQNATLRHKFGDARTRTAAAESSAAQAEVVVAQAHRSMASAAATADADSRRLRARVEELEQEASSLRRAERSDRGQAALRARLLLDTLLDSAQGLRRELALPAVEGAPADGVEAHLAEQGSRASSGHGSMANDDPVLLEQLLALPRTHLVVDGYNVTMSTWPDLDLERQRERLLSGLAPLAARSGVEVSVVFDAADKKDRPLVNRPRNVRVLFSPVGVIADDVIRELVSAEPIGRPLVVVTSDRAVVDDVVRSGARAVAAAALGRLLLRP